MLSVAFRNPVCISTEKIVRLDWGSINGVKRLLLEKNVKFINEKTTLTTSHRRLI